MDDRAAQATELLGQYKQQAMPYFQAAQALQKQGFSQAEIDQAAVDTQYNPKPAVAGPPETDEQKQLDQDEADLQALKAEDKLDHPDRFFRL